MPWKGDCTLQVLSLISQLFELLPPQAIFSESSASDSDRGNRRKKSPSPVRTSGGSKKAKTGAGSAASERPKVSYMLTHLVEAVVLNAMCCSCSAAARPVVSWQELNSHSRLVSLYVFYCNPSLCLLIRELTSKLGKF